MLYLVKLMTSILNNLNSLFISNIHCLSHHSTIWYFKESFYKFNQLKY